MEDRTDSAQFSESSYDIVRLLLILWARKWFILSVTVLAAIAASAFALLQTEWYRAEVLLAPAQQRSTPEIPANLSGLAGLAGVTTARRSGSAEAMAILRSRDFLRRFIDDNQLKKVLYADYWDEANKRWLYGPEKTQPDVRDAVRLFREQVVSVSQDSETGLVTLFVQWTEPRIAAEWANSLVRMLNEEVRQREYSAAESNVSYLQSELQTTNVVSLEQTISRLLESELQKLMLARGADEFAFRVLDHAEVPKERFRPKRTLIVIVLTFSAFIGAVLITLFVQFLAMVKARSASAL